MFHNLYSKIRYTGFINWVAYDDADFKTTYVLMSVAWATIG